MLSLERRRPWGWVFDDVGIYSGVDAEASNDDGREGGKCMIMRDVRRGGGESQARIKRVVVTGGSSCVVTIDFGLFTRIVNSHTLDMHQGSGIRAINYSFSCPETLILHVLR